MATHPYISGAGNISQMITQLRKNFPNIINADTIKKFGIASNNESYVINTLQFIGVIDIEGKKTPQGSEVFSHHKNDDFSLEFSKLIQKSYNLLFELYGDSAWTLSNQDLITFFRRTDQTSDIIGKRQASTFRTLSALSGRGEIPEVKPKKATNNGNPTKSSKTKPSTESKNSNEQDVELKPSKIQSTTNGIGLTVRIEINLPADGSKETYDNIFRSIKENLLNG